MAKDKKSIANLTEYSDRFVQLSPRLWDGYIGLRHHKDTTLANCLFSFLLSNKKYKHYNIPEEKKDSEDRRIHTSVHISTEDILYQINSSKYVDGADIRNDISNMTRDLNRLHDNNVFYHWKYRGSYIFIMERDIRAIKDFNSVGAVPPKTIKKILRDAYAIFMKMSRFYYDKNNVRVDKVKLEKSFGGFIDGMILKMPKVVYDKIPLWNGDTPLFEYTRNLEEAMKNIDDEEGIEETDSFLYRLPPSIRSLVLEQRGIKEDEMTNMDMQKNLVPKEGKIGGKNKPKRESETTAKAKAKAKAKKNISKVDPNKSIPPVLVEYRREVDPFNGAPSFVKYFQKSLRSFNSRAIQADIKYETTDAGVVIDKMGENGRAKDLEFLTSWMNWYFKYNLKGKKIFNLEHTCIKKFGKTFEKFNSTYLSQKDKMNFIPE